MIYRRNPTFRKSFQDLPKEIQDKAAKAFELFKTNRDHPSLDIKPVRGHEGVWEGRIDRFYRFTFEYKKDEKTGETVCRFRNIGRHEIVRRSP